MTKAVEKPEDTQALLELERQLAETTDLYRNGGGFGVSVIYLPDMVKPKEAQIIVKTGDGAKIDDFKVPIAKAWDAFTHTTQYSKKLSEFLVPGRQKKGK